MFNKKRVTKCFCGLGYIIIILALMACSLRLATPLLARYQLEIQNKLSHLLHNDIHIESINASWYGAEPVIRFNTVVIKSKNTQKKLLSIKRLSLGLNIWRSLTTLSIQPGTFVLEGAKLQVLKNNHNQYQIKGMDTLTLDQNNTLDREDVIPQNIIDWLMSQNELRLSSVLLQFKTKKRVINTAISSLKVIKENALHKFEGLIKIKNTLDTQLRVVGHWKGEELSQLSGKFYTSIKNLPVNFMNDYLPIENISLISGNAKVELWGDLSPHLSLHSQGKLRLDNLVFENVKTKKTKKIKFLKTDVSYSNANKEAKIFFKNLAFSPYIKFNKEHSFLWQKKGKRTVIQFSYANLSSMDEWIHFINPSFYNRFKSHHFHGALTNTQIHLIQGEFQLLFGQFEEVGLHHHEDVSFTNLSGEISIDNKHGLLTLNSKKASVHLPNPIDKTISINRLKGRYRWIKIDDFWRVSSDDAYISLDNLTLSNQFVFDWKGNIHNSELALGIDYSGRKIEELTPYLPTKGMSQKLKKWLEKALVSVPRVSGHAMVKGRLGDFPFDKTNGTLEANLYAEEAILKYHPSWPIATQLDAQLFFNKRVMSAHIKHALIEKNNVSNLSLLIKPLGTEKQSLLLTVNDQFDSSSLVNFVLNTPLKNKLNMLSTMDFSKKIILDLNLTIPLYDNEKHKPLWGSIKFNNNSLDFSPTLDMNLSAIKGELLFNEKGIINSQLSANLLSYPLDFSIENQTLSPTGLMIMGKGKMSIRQLKDKYRFLPIDDFEGTLSYKGSLFFPDDKPETVVNLSSYLNEIQTKLPPPFATLVKHETLTLHSKIETDNFLLALSVRDKFNSHFNFKKTADGYSLEKGQLFFGKNRTHISPPNIMLVEGHIDELSVSAWRNWFENTTVFNETHAASIPLYAKLIIKKLEFNQKKYSQTWVDFKPFETAHLLTVVNDKIKGKAYFPPNFLNKGIDIQLDFFHFENTNALEDNNFNALLSLPPLNININELTYNGALLGALTLKSKVDNTTFIIEALSLTSPLYGVNLVGHWAENKASSKVSLEGVVQSNSLSTVLEKGGILPVIESKKSLLTFNVNAHKSLNAIELKDFNGNLSLKLTNGRITHLSEDVEKSLGLGKLISILSLQTLPRRLTLDFSDLSKDGFTFDILKGDFVLSKGRLSTSNSYLDGPVSYVSMKGALNILKKNYDLTLKIVPHITASLPVVATIAGGPIAGIAAWVASKIINQGIRKVTSYTYKILGPWEHPVVHQVSISKSKKIIK